MVRFTTYLKNGISDDKNADDAIFVENVMLFKSIFVEYRETTA